MEDTRKCGAGDVHPLGERFPGLRQCPSIQRQVGMALFVMAMGPEKVGVDTKHKLMWPYTDYDDDDVRRAAAMLLERVLVALLADAPAPRIDRIQKEIDAYLSFAQGDGSLDDETPSRATR